MAENKKSFVLYADYIATFEELTDDEAGKLIKHILRYVNDQNPEAPDKITKVVFEPIKQQLKRDLTKWDEKKAKRSEIGKKGAEARWQNMPEASLGINEMAKMPVTVTVNDNVNVTVITIGGEKRLPEDLKKLLIADSGLLMQWKQKGFKDADFENGIDLFLSLKLHETYNDFLKFRNNFIFWMPNYLRAAGKVKAEQPEVKYDINQQVKKYLV